jgi:hypothetical protein
MVSIVYNDNVMALPQTFMELKQKLGEKEIAYYDDEGDKITISNQYDLDQAFIYCNKESIEVLNIIANEMPIRSDEKNDHNELSLNKSIISSVMLSQRSGRDIEVPPIRPLSFLQSSMLNSNLSRCNKDNDKWFLYFIDNIVSRVNSLNVSKPIKKPILKRCYIVKQKPKKREIKPETVDVINKLIDEKIENLKQFIMAKYSITQKSLMM